MTPTDDEIIKFAAKKLGVEIHWDQRYGIHYVPALAGCGLDTAYFNPLTSWEWLEKGMVASRAERGFIPTICGYRFHVSVGGCIEQFTSIADIPRAFWTAWWDLVNKENS